MIMKYGMTWVEESMGIFFSLSFLAKPCVSDKSIMKNSMMRNSTMTLSFLQILAQGTKYPIHLVMYGVSAEHSGAKKFRLKENIWAIFTWRVLKTEINEIEIIYIYILDTGIHVYIYMKTYLYQFVSSCIQLLIPKSETSRSTLKVQL